MGSPDLPNEENNLPTPLGSSLPMHGGNITASDDSDMDNVDNGYAGYQPLAFDEETMEYTNDNANNELDDENEDEDDHFDYSVRFKNIIDFIHSVRSDFENFRINFQAFNAPTMAPETGIVVPSIDAEVESQVWNAPRPESTNIVLDSARTEQVGRMS